MRYSWITIVNGCTQRTKFKCINLIVYRIPFTWHLRSFLWKVPIVLCCPSFSAGIRLGKCEWTLSFGRSTRCSERKSPGPRAIPSERWTVPSEARSAWSLSLFHPSWWLSDACFLTGTNCSAGRHTAMTCEKPSNWCFKNYWPLSSLRMVGVNGGYYPPQNEQFRPWK